MNEHQIKLTFGFLKSDKIAKLIGILSHSVYWSVFGGFNKLSIDKYHMESMLKSILNQAKDIEQSFIDRYCEHHSYMNGKK